MSFLNKLMFWKSHEDEFKLGEEPLPGEKLGGDLGLPELEGMPKPVEEPRHEETETPMMRGYPGMQQPSFQQQYPQPQAYAQPQMVQQSSPQMELINSKLDAIKAMLSVLEQKMVNLERGSGQGHEKKYW